MGSFPWAPTPSNLGVRRPRHLVGSPGEARFRRPGSWMEERRGCLPPLPRQAPGTGSRGRRPLPPRLPRGDLVARAHSPSAPTSPLPGHARLAAVYTRGPAAPTPPVPAAPPARLGSQAAAARARYGPTDQPAESFSTERGGAGRGAGRRGGKGPGEEGESAGGREEGSKVCGASAPPQETAGEAGCRDPPPGY